MLRIALTGSIGAGKSSAAEIIRERGFTVIDADALSREVTKPGTLLLAYIGKVFGETVIKPDGSLDRAELSRLAFADAALYLRMNGLVQTAIKIRLLEKMEALRSEGEAAIFAEVPLLFEAGWDREFDRVWTVSAPYELRISRVMARSGLTREQVLARMERQRPQEEKEKRSDLIIENSGDLAKLSAQVLSALEETVTGLE